MNSIERRQSKKDENQSQWIEMPNLKVINNQDFNKNKSYLQDVSLKIILFYRTFFISFIENILYFSFIF